MSKLDPCQQHGVRRPTTADGQVLILSRSRNLESIEWLIRGALLPPGGRTRRRPLGSLTCTPHGRLVGERLISQDNAGVVALPAPMDVDAMFSIPEVAERYSVTRNTVLGWIAAGLLAAIDVAPVGSKRKYYRVTPEALLAFEAKRTTQPAQRRQATPLPPVKQYV